MIDFKKLSVKTRTFKVFGWTFVLNRTFKVFGWTFTLFKTFKALGWTFTLVDNEIPYPYGKRPKVWSLGWYGNRNITMIPQEDGVGVQGMRLHIGGTKVDDFTDTKQDAIVECLEDWIGKYFKLIGLQAQPPNNRHNH